MRIKFHYLLFLPGILYLQNSATPDEERYPGPKLNTDIGYRIIVNRLPDI